MKERRLSFIDSHTTASDGSLVVLAVIRRTTRTGEAYDRVPLVLPDYLVRSLVKRFGQVLTERREYEARIRKELHEVFA